jgi:hypothetical protein
MKRTAMVEHILKINVSELQVVRLTCRQCKATAEMKIDALTDRTTKCTCPFCQKPYLYGGDRAGGTPFEELRQSLKSVREANNLDMEFVIPTGQGKSES